MLLKLDILSDIETESEIEREEEEEQLCHLVEFKQELKLKLGSELEFLKAYWNCDPICVRLNRRFPYFEEDIRETEEYLNYLSQEKDDAFPYVIGMLTILYERLIDYRRECEIYCQSLRKIQRYYRKWYYAPGRKGYQKAYLHFNGRG